MSDVPARPTFISSVFYRDPMAALGWLEAAFGFELVELLVDSEGRNTQCLRVRVDGDLGAHCERARAVGAVIAEEPADQFYGDRTYRAFDLEGHNWTFAQTVRGVPLDEMERASGLRFAKAAQG